MNHAIRVGGITLCAVMLCPALGASADVAAPPAAGPAGCVACRHVCRSPLNLDDGLLDDATDLYLPAAVRDSATAAAIDMAVALKQVYDEHAGGHFQRVYEAHATEIDSLAAERIPSRATTAETNALKRARTALYADAVVALQAAAANVQSETVTAAYNARAAVLDGVIQSMSAPQQMRPTERLAVCQVLAAYDDKEPAGAVPHR